MSLPQTDYLPLQLPWHCRTGTCGQPFPMRSGYGQRSQAPPGLCERGRGLSLAWERSRAKAMERQSLLRRACPERCNLPGGHPHAHKRLPPGSSSAVHAVMGAQTVPKPGRARQGRSPLELQSNPAACTPDSRQFLRRGACPPEKKLLPCSFRARKCAAFQRKLRGGGSLPGELAPPSTSWFDKLNAVYTVQLTR